MRGTLLAILPGFPGDVCKVACVMDVEAFEVTRLPLRLPDAFQQQMIKAERKIERWIAIPGAFCVQEYSSVRAGQNVFRADVAMHESFLGRTGNPDQTLQPVSAIGMPLRGSRKIRLKSNREKDVVGGKFLCDVDVAGRVRVNRTNALTYFAGGVLDNHAVTQLIFPDGITCLVLEFHCEHAGFPVFSEHFWNSQWFDAGCGAHPLDLIAVAFDRRLPIHLYFEPGERALYADWSALQIDARDV